MTRIRNVAARFRNTAAGFRTAAGAAAAALLLIFGGSLTALAETTAPTEQEITSAPEDSTALAETADSVTRATGAGPGGIAASAGTSSLLEAPAPYSYLTTAYRARLPYAESELDDYGRSLTRVFDRGEYYELTNVNLYAHRKYNAEEVENAAVGDRLNIEGKAYTLKQILDDGTRILERKNAFETTAIRLVPVNPGRGKTGYYISVKQDAAGGSAGIAELGVDSAEIYYGGSIFIKKDCVMRSLLAGDDGAKKEVTAETYLTVDRKSFSPEELFRYGCDAGEGLVLLRGYFTTDQSGVFTSYEEKN